MPKDANSTSAQTLFLPIPKHSPTRAPAFNSCFAPNSRRNAPVAAVRRHHGVLVGAGEGEEDPLVALGAATVADQRCEQRDARVGRGMAELLAVISGQTQQFTVAPQWDCNAEAVVPRHATAIK